MPRTTDDLRSLRKQQAKELYEQGYDSAQIGELLDVHQFTVRRWLHDQDVKVMSASARTKARNRKYIHNPNLFATFAPYTAYYAGWLMADGNVSTAANMVQIEIHRRDRQFLVGLKKALGYTGPISARTRVSASGTKSKMVALRVCDAAQLITDLAVWGVVPRKSRRSAVGRKVGIHGLQEFYFRGLFEGDGSVGRRKSKPYYSFLTVAGSPAVVDAFRDWCWQEVREVGSLNRRTDLTHVVTFGAKNAELVHKRLYRSKECPRLNRKAKL